LHRFYLVKWFSPMTHKICIILYNIILIGTRIQIITICISITWLITKQKTIV